MRKYPPPGGSQTLLSGHLCLWVLKSFSMHFEGPSSHLVVFLSFDHYDAFIDCSLILNVQCKVILMNGYH